MPKPIEFERHHSRRKGTIVGAWSKGGTEGGRATEDNMEDSNTIFMRRDRTSKTDESEGRVKTGLQEGGRGGKLADLCGLVTFLLPLALILSPSDASLPCLPEEEGESVEKRGSVHITIKGRKQ